MSGRVLCVNTFQFHKGTIKTGSLRRLHRLQRYFNSIKVQLKPASLQKLGMLKAFQFHKGTIKTKVADFKRVLPKHISIP